MQFETGGNEKGISKIKVRIENSITLSYLKPYFID